MRKVPILVVGYEALNEQMMSTGAVHGRIFADYDKRALSDRASKWSETKVGKTESTTRTTPVLCQLMSRHEDTHTFKFLMPTR
jgi:hypothetical protein